MKVNTDSQQNKQTTRSAANQNMNGNGVSAMPPPIQLQTNPFFEPMGGSGGGQQSQPAGPSQITGPGASVSVANGVANISAPMVNIDSPMVRVNGILQSDTLIANSVIASSYTPGAGNTM